MAAPLDDSARRREERSDDSAAVTLRHLEQDCGGMLEEKDYQQMRRAIVEELARGAECRTFTLFTFGAVGLGLLALLVLGIAIARDDLAGGPALISVSTAALAVWGWLLWSFVRGIREDARRPLEERLAELEQLRLEGLISRDEYEYIRAGILMSRQRTRRGLILRGTPKLPASANSAQRAGRTMDRLT